MADYPFSTSSSISIHLMFPDAYDDPAHSPQFSVIFRVSQSRSIDFLLPLWRKLLAPCREPPPVPEVPVYENGDQFLPKDKIGSPRQISGVPFPPQAVALKLLRDHPLGAGILATNSRHYAATRLWRHYVATTSGISRFWDAGQGAPPLVKAKSRPQCRA